MTATIVGFPRIGENRELKFITEKYFKHEATEEELKERAKDLRQHDRKLLLDSGLTNFTSNHFSFYDQMLDAAFLFNVIPENIAELDLSDLDKYFALARGYQGEKGDVKAWPMKKWFNTNYHYIVPQFTADTDVKLAGTKIFDEFVEAKEDGTITRPVLVGPFTLLQLSEFHGCVKEDFVGAFIESYARIFKQLEDLGANWIQLDEPSLVKDLDERELALFKALYEPLLLQKGRLKVLAQTYFGDVRDAYDVLLKLPFDGIGLDFVEGRKTLELVERGFDDGKVLFAGVVNGKNIWRNNYQKTLDLLKKLNVKNLVLTTSCSLLHVPYTVASEELEEDVTKHFAFAEEKVRELVELDALLKNQSPEFLRKNAELFEKPRVLENAELHQKIADLKPEAFVRQPEFAVREKIQKRSSICRFFRRRRSGPSRKREKSSKSVPHSESMRSARKNTTNLLLKELIRGSDYRKKSAWTFWFTANLKETTWSNISDSILKDTSSPKRPGFNRMELAASSRRLSGATFQEKTRLLFDGRFMRKSRRKKSSKGC